MLFVVGWSCDIFLRELFFFKVFDFLDKRINFLSLFWNDNKIFIKVLVIIEIKVILIKFKFRCFNIFK